MNNEQGGETPMAQDRTAMVRRAWDLLPGSFGEAMEIAKLIADSDFAPRDYKGKPANVVIAVQMGADLGLRPLQAIQSIAVINGRPSVWGDAALALVMASNQVETFREWEDEKNVAHCLIKRRGYDPVERTFGLEDAKIAGLLRKTGPWTNYPKRMRQMRARSFALRDAAPDLLMGLGIAEELQDAAEPKVLLTDAALVQEVPPEQQARIDKAFETLNLSPAERRIYIMKHLTADRPLSESVEAMLADLEDEYAKRKTGKPAKRKPKTPPPTSQGEALVEELDKGPVSAPVTTDEDKAIDAEAEKQTTTAPAPKATGTSGRFGF